MQFYLHIVALYANMIAYGTKAILAGRDKGRVEETVGALAVGSTARRKDYALSKHPRN